MPRTTPPLGQPDGRRPISTFTHSLTGAPVCWRRAVLVSQPTYGRRRGVSHQAVQKRTTSAGGPIPVHGPRKLIDVAEADALWTATMVPNGVANTRAATGAARAGKRSPS